MALTHARLRHHILTCFVDEGRAPSVEAMRAHFGVSRDEMVAALEALQDYHGVVLHPGSAEVWAIHPFATAPTNFWIEADGRGWWGNCAWCSLGAAALLDRDLTITTTLGGESRQAEITIRGGEILDSNYFVHFLIPMTRAWDNVTYTCSTMLLFDSADEVDGWCARHAIPRGDVQPIETIWRFAQVWYGNHLDPEWEKWTVDEARELFERFGLTLSIWEMPAAAGRF